MNRLSLLFLFLFGMLTMGCGAPPVKTQIKYIPCHQVCPPGVVPAAAAPRSQAPVVKATKESLESLGAEQTRLRAPVVADQKPVSERVASRVEAPRAEAAPLVPWATVNKKLSAHKDARQCVARRKAKGHKPSAKVVADCNVRFGLTADGKHLASK